jgi:hypothetical protein
MASKILNLAERRGLFVEQCFARHSLMTRIIPTYQSNPSSFRFEAANDEKIGCVVCPPAWRAPHQVERLSGLRKRLAAV